MHSHECVSAELQMSAWMHAYLHEWLSHKLTRLFFFFFFFCLKIKHTQLCVPSFWDETENDRSELYPPPTRWCLILSRTVEKRKRKEGGRPFEPCGHLSTCGPQVCTLPDNKWLEKKERFEERVESPRTERKRDICGGSGYHTTMTHWHCKHLLLQCLTDVSACLFHFSALVPHGESLKVQVNYRWHLKLLFMKLKKEKERIKSMFKRCNFHCIKT